MNETEPAPAPDDALRRLRKADVWTGLVLAVVAVAMVAEALTFPLEGTYAGVRNAWYVSPALFPLIVGCALFALSLALLAKAVKDVRRLQPGGYLLLFERSAAAGRGDAWLVSLLLAAYIVGLVPRVDFTIATALFLIVFMGVYVVSSASGRIALTGTLIVAAVAGFAGALLDAWPAPRSDAQYAVDGVFAGIVVLASVLLALFARGTERKRVLTVIATGAGTALVLSLVFKYGLLVPLPREGVGVLVLDAAVNAIPGWDR